MRAVLQTAQLVSKRQSITDANESRDEAAAACRIDAGEPGVRELGEGQADGAVICPGVVSKPSTVTDEWKKQWQVLLSPFLYTQANSWGAGPSLRMDPGEMGKGSQCCSKGDDPRPS